MRILLLLKKLGGALLGVVFLCGIGVWFGVVQLCDGQGVRHLLLKGDGASDEYLLVAPHVGGGVDVPGRVELVSPTGATVHEWNTSAQVLIAHLLKNGHVLVSMINPDIDVRDKPGPGTTGILQELTWEGDVVWEYRDSDMAFDVAELPNGAIAYLRWEKAPPSFTHFVRGGFGPRDETWTTGIRIINREGESLYDWHMYEHVEPWEYELNENVAAKDWAHTNSLVYVPVNPITGTPAFLMSVRHISTLLLVDAESGEILWRSPEGMFSLQHDASVLENGNILVFDNGLFRENVPALLSRVVEINPRTNAIVWQYHGGSSITEQAQFATSIMGSAERLSNGNTLIALSTSGRIEEVSPEGSVVWRYVNDFRDPSGDGIVFHARKYDAQGTEWGSKVAGVTFLSNLMCR